MLPLVYEVKDLGEDVGTLPRVDGSFIKYAGLRRRDELYYLPGQFISSPLTTLKQVPRLRSPRVNTLAQTSLFS